MGFHFILQQLDILWTNAKTQFVDFCPRFNTIIPELQTKPSQLTVPDPICWWIISFPTSETHQVKLEEQMSNTSSAVTCYCFSYSTPVADLFVKPKVYWQHNCSAAHIALFITGEESACRHEVEQLAVRFRQNNLALNSAKTVKMRGEFRRSQSSSYLASQSALDIVIRVFKIWNGVVASAAFLLCNNCVHLRHPHNIASNHPAKSLAATCPPSRTRREPGLGSVLFHLGSAETYNTKTTTLTASTKLSPLWTKICLPPQPVIHALVRKHRFSQQHPRQRLWL